MPSSFCLEIFEAEGGESLLRAEQPSSFVEQPTTRTRTTKQGVSWSPFTVSTRKHLLGNQEQ